MAAMARALATFHSERSELKARALLDLKASAAENMVRMVLTLATFHPETLELKALA